jgi:hypothetical protein
VNNFSETNCSVAIIMATTGYRKSEAAVSRNSSGNHKSSRDGCSLDDSSVLMNTLRHADHPKSDPRFARRIRGVKASRLRAWNVLQRLRLILSESGNVVIPPSAQKTFDAEGEVLERALTTSFRLRNDAIKSLCSSVRRFRDAT